MLDQVESWTVLQLNGRNSRSIRTSTSRAEAGGRCCRHRDCGGPSPKPVGVEMTVVDKCHMYRLLQSPPVSSPILFDDIDKACLARLYSLRIVARFVTKALRPNPFSLRQLKSVVKWSNI